MTDEKLNIAITEAKRFLDKAKALQDRRTKKDLYDWQGCKESGAVRRSSLDLTRALSDLRKY